MTERLTPKEEAEAVLKAYQPTLVAGAEWAVVEAKWYESWASYSGLNADKKEIGEGRGSRPGPIDNTPLQDDDNKLALKAGIVERQDFVLVHKDVWDLLVGWYTGGPVFIRSVIEFGVSKSTQLELYPFATGVTETDEKTGEPDVPTRAVQFLSKQRTLQSLLDSLKPAAEAKDEKEGKESKEGEDKKEGVDKKDEKDDEGSIRLWLFDQQKADKHRSAAAKAAAADPPSITNLSLNEEAGAGAGTGAGAGEPAAPSADAAPGGAGASEPVTAGAGAAGPGEKPARPFTPYRLLEKAELEATLESMNLSDRKLEVLVERALASPGEGQSRWPRARFVKDWRDFEVGDIIDARDTVGKWYESKVIKVKEEEVFVNYIGWAETWNEWLRKDDAERVAKKGTYSVPKGSYSSAVTYTGFSSWKATSDEGAPPQHGAVGFRNLGNTCFMNSTLQCLSHAPFLTPFFLSDDYLAQINRDNPLGNKGRIADEYGAMLKEIWSDKYTVVAPSKFKEVIGQFAPRFSGYQQQDSQELLGFLLDGLHEDLNRVLKKPPTGTVESKGRPDQVVAAEAWETYQMRNQSVIVDNVCGQLKSRVECPVCPKVSITFDPCLFLSVPLPTIAEKVQEVIFVWADPSKPITVFGAKVSSVAMLPEIKRVIGAQAGVSPKRLVFADVWHSRVYRFLEDDAGVSDMRPTDKIFCFEVPSMETFADGVPVQVVHQKPSSGMSDPCFGLPKVIALPRKSQLTGKQITDLITEAVGACRAASAPESAYTIVQLSDDGRNCKKCKYSAACSGCPLPADDTPFNNGDSRESKSSFALAWRDVDFYSVESEKEIRDSSVGASLQKREDEIGLMDCIRAFTKQETLGEEDAWYCSDCKEFRQAHKKMDMYKLPNILIVHLKRFSYTRMSRDKLNTLVDFPLDGLDLSELVTSDEEKANAQYDLFAVSNHMGGLGGGHYHAYVRNLVDGQWYCHDDSRVSRISTNEVKSTMAYVLFYRRRSANAAPGAPLPGALTSLKPKTASAAAATEVASSDMD